MRFCSQYRATERLDFVKENEARLIKSFVQKDLGCGCPDEVFSTIQIEKDPDALNGLPIDYIITIGNRLLIGICLCENPDTGFIKDIKQSLAAGKQLRDKNDFNRFRLVVVSDVNESILEKVWKEYEKFGGLDDRVHLHLLRPSMIPAIFKTGRPSL